MSAQENRLASVDLAGLADCGIDPTSHAIESILPYRHATLLGSHGGAGKSMLALTFAAHKACGRDWCGLSVPSGPALYVSLEDPGELVRYRLRRIADEYDLDHAAITDGLLVLDGSAADSVLAAEVNDYGTRRIVPTSVMDEVRSASVGRRLIVIDNASDAFDADENSRRMVRAFVRSLAQIAQNEDAALLLLAHIDKSAARGGANGNTYSGSTAWHNSARSRLALVDVDGRIDLVQEKNNLGRKAAPIALTWSDQGVLVPVSPGAAGNVARQDDAAVHAAIRVANAADINVPVGRSGASTAYSVLVTLPELPKALRVDKSRFWAALTRLERAELIYRETYRNAQRHTKERLIARAL